MNLTTAAPPYKETVTRTREIVVKPARYKNDILLDPVIEQRDYETEIWIVETTYGETTERHEFSNKDDADRYYGGF